MRSFFDYGIFKLFDGIRFFFDFSALGEEKPWDLIFDNGVLDFSLGEKKREGLILDSGVEDEVNVVLENNELFGDHGRATFDTGAVFFGDNILRKGDFDLSSFLS